MGNFILNSSIFTFNSVRDLDEKVESCFYSESSKNYLKMRILDALKVSKMKCFSINSCFKQSEILFSQSF